MQNMFSEKFKDALKQKKVKPAELSRRTGIDDGSISRYITGEREPSPDHIILIEDALDLDRGVALSWFEDGEPNLEQETKIQKYIHLIKRLPESIADLHIAGLEKLANYKGDQVNEAKVKKAIRKSPK